MPLHAVLALVASVLGLLGMLLHLVRARQSANELDATENETPSAAVLQVPVAMVVRRRNLRLWVSLRQLPRGQR
jgi:hypothetical protein